MLRSNTGAGAQPDTRIAQHSIRRLPLEVLLELFVVFQQLDPRPSHLLRISHVCRQWRQLIHGFSRFWSGLDLCVSNPEIDLQAAYWLERAGQQLLCISIRHDGSNEPDGIISKSTLLRLVHILRPSVPRWVSFLAQFLPSYAELFFEECRGPASRLRLFSIELVGPVYDHDILMPKSILLGSDPDTTPNASNEVWVHAIRCIPIFAPLGSRVTDLQLHIGGPIGFVSADDLLAMISSCPNITRLHLIGPRGQTLSEPLREESVVLPHLVELEIKCIREVDFLLRHTTFPTLRSLVLMGFEWCSEIVDILDHVFRTCESLAAVELRHGFDEGFSPGAISSNPIVATSLVKFHMDVDPIALPLLRLLVIPNVRDLDIRNAPFEIVHWLCSHSNFLHAASFSAISHLPPPHQITSFPTLASLYISDTPQLLDHVQTPRLENLTVCGVSNRSSHLKSSLRSLIERSGPALLTLQLTHLVVADRDLVWCLQRLPLITRLDITACSVTDTLLRSLSTPISTEQGTEWLLPRLKSIVLAGNSHMTPSGVIVFLKSRNSPHHLETNSTRPPRVASDVTFAASAHVEEGAMAEIRVSSLPPLSLRRLQL
ncbi:hypothetical protein BOTBODRAFT_221872 [Botryobasidium botryosum FD-172 SS1]|uniref:F-box domain-containing protein n=1 Tax=Botryobasidium botryosum (strain FD-172 SS1) TaxID=930990 RepID=A0A067MYL0_BOTB1|nr:hypothetical protein BOTBODRAFT_221872 [Botryobasidium botryosum FD-172 SS1]